jgi:hypothetical protein
VQCSGPFRTASPAKLAQITARRYMWALCRSKWLDQTTTQRHHAIFKASLDHTAKSDEAMVVSVLALEHLLNCHNDFYGRCVYISTW